MLPEQNIFGDKKLQIVRHAGDLQSVYLPEDGATVHRQKEVTIPGIDGSPNKVVMCAGYDNHFTFRHVFTKKGKVLRGWTLFCTCGSPSAITGWDGYFKDASPQGELLVCMHHAMYGMHADGSS